MSVALAATARIAIAYVVDGLHHVIHHYCAYNLVLGVPQLVDRDGITTILWTLAAGDLWSVAKGMFTAASVPSVPTATLESRSGALWNPVAVTSLVGIGTHGGTYNKASELTFVLRDTLFKKVRVNWLEGAFGYVGHSATGTGIEASVDGMANMYNGANAGANDPYRWVKSRGDRFLAPTGVIAGGTLDLNDKLKRARGLA